MIATTDLLYGFNNSGTEFYRRVRYRDAEGRSWRLVGESYVSEYEWPHDKPHWGL